MVNQLLSHLLHAEWSKCEIIKITWRATDSLVVGMKEPFGRGMRNQIILSKLSNLVGSLEEGKDSLAWILTVPRLMLQLERVVKGVIMMTEV